MKKRRIKWENVIKLVVFIACAIFILRDVYMVTLHSWFTGQLVGWTWYGLATLVLVIIIAGAIYEDFEEQIQDKE